MIELKRIIANIVLLKKIEKQARKDKKKGYLDRCYGKLEEDPLKEYEESLMKEILDQYEKLFNLMINLSGCIYRINNIKVNIVKETENEFDDNMVLFSNGFVLGKGTTNRKIYLRRKKAAEKRSKELCVE